MIFYNYVLFFVGLDESLVKYFFGFNFFVRYNERIFIVNRDIFRMYYLGIVVFKYFYFNVLEI